MGERKKTATRRGAERRRRILDAAMEVFLERGFEAASMQEIVKRSGGSLATLYQFFGAKEALFEEIIRSKASQVIGEFSAPEALPGKPESVLKDFGKRLLDLALSEEALPLHRLILAESGRMPRLREMFLAQAPVRARDAVAAYLRYAGGQGLLRVEDAAFAATAFIEMVAGEFIVRRLLGEAVEPNRSERERIVDKAVALLVEGIGPIRRQGQMGGPG